MNFMYVKNILITILKSQDFNRLSEFEDAAKWESLNVDERELLGLLFVMQGEKYLHSGDKRALDSFEKANLAAPNRVEIMFRQAVAFSKQKNNILSLKAADKIFEKIIKLNPNLFRVWHAWANTGVLIAIHYQTENHFQKAINRFQKALVHAEKKSAKSSAAAYRDLGILWFHYGRMSGEAYEIFQSIQYFEKSIELGMNAFDLWNAYGNSLIELGTLYNRPQFIHEAVRLYWKSVKLKNDFLEGWSNLSTALKELYQISSQDAYFSVANMGFEKALKLDPENVVLWVKWGQLLAFKGKRFKEVDLLEESCKKFQTADLYESHNPAILSSWAESLVFLGEWNEDLNALRLAESKILQSLQKQRDNPRIWCLYGNCLSEIGRYFEEESYFIRALEKYESALKLIPGDPEIWHRQGLAYLNIGLLRQDIKLLDKAGQCLMSGIENGGFSQADIWNDWGFVLLKIGMMSDQCEVVERSISRFEQALRLSTQKGGGNANAPQWWYNYGCALDFLGDYHNDGTYLEKAAQVFQKVVEIDPFFYHAYFNLALTVSHFADLSSSPEGFILSFSYLETYLEFEPEDEDAWNEWGLILIDYAQLILEPIRIKEYEQLLKNAEEKFFHARNLGSSLAYYHLGSLYSLMGNYESAFECLYKAKENGILPSHDELISNPWLESVRDTREFQKLIIETEEML